MIPVDNIHKERFRRVGIREERMLESVQEWPVPVLARGRSFLSRNGRGFWATLPKHPSLLNTSIFEPPGLITFPSRLPLPESQQIPSPNESNTSRR